MTLRHYLGEKGNVQGPEVGSAGEGLLYLWGWGQLHSRSGEEPLVGSEQGVTDSLPVMFQGSLFWVQSRFKAGVG